MMEIRIGFRIFASLLAIVAMSLTISVCPERANAQAVLINVANDITDPFNLDDSEPSIAVNPLNPLEISIVTFAEGFSPGIPGPVYRSTDGGMTWTKIFIIPSPPSDESGPLDQ